MKTTPIIIIGLLLMIHVSCEGPKPEEDSPLEHQTEELIHKIKEGDLEILVIEGCEYIIYKEAEGTNHAYGYMSHKGNCKNPIHQYHIVNSTIPDSLKTEGSESKMEK